METTLRQIGDWNEGHGAEAFGFDGLAGLNWNLEPPVLVERALRRGEAMLSSSGALAAETGAHTGRSPKDKFIVRDAETENTIWWDNAAALTPEQFDALKDDFIAHARGRELFAQDLNAGADPAHRLKVRVYTEYAWHSLFIRTMLIPPARGDLATFTPELTIVDLPGFKADPERHGVRSQTVIAIDLTRRIVLIGGTAYAGEMKKSVFSVLNYLLPERGVMPMHCSANVGREGDVAVFFGLSGTGKTTLSADPSRTLIGDDEHGWSKDGVFNFEGGCYAKTIRLRPKSEPQIANAIRRFGVILENVPLDPVTRQPDYDDGSLTENTRAAYPLRYVKNASATGRAGLPRNIVMLTADAFGVMPPIAKLTPAQAMYHFLSGYTAKVAGTETGLKEPQATFSTCFGAPFMPRPAQVYGALLKRLIDEHQVDCWLVNTGWTGGGYGDGQRMPIEATRALLATALDGRLGQAETYTDPNFGFAVPVEVPGVAPELLRPRDNWADKAAYDRAARRLVEMFAKNFESFADVEAEVRDAAPGFRAAAE